MPSNQHKPFNYSPDSAAFDCLMTNRHIILFHCFRTDDSKNIICNHAQFQNESISIKSAAFSQRYVRGLPAAILRRLLLLMRLLLMAGNLWLWLMCRMQVQFSELHLFSALIVSIQIFLSTIFYFFSKNNVNIPISTIFIIGNYKNGGHFYLFNGEILICSGKSFLILLSSHSTPLYTIAIPRVCFSRISL